MTSTLAALLFDAATSSLSQTPRLTVTAGIEEALELLEAQTLHRSRTVYAHAASTLTDLREGHPDVEPLSPIMLLAEAPTAAHRSRLAALLSQGQRLDIHGVLLGAWPDGPTVTIAENGATTPAGDESEPVDIDRLTVLTADETIDLLTTLAESHTGEQPTSTASVTLTTSSSRTATAAVHSQEPLPDAVTSTSTSPSSEMTPIATTSPPRALIDPDRPLQGDTDAPSATSSTIPGRVAVTVLGTPAILGAPKKPGLRRKSMEVLVYLVTHDGTASAEAILDDLLPEAPANKAPGRLYTYVSDLRAMMRRIAGSGDYLTYQNHRYTLNPAAVDADLWRMRAAIRDADQATDPQVRLAALRRAADSYSGHLAAGAEYEWVEPYREAVRQQALDIALALVDSLSDSPGEQLSVLDTAIRHNRYAEELYQQAMRVRAALGQLDAVRSLHRNLSRVLGEIDTEPSEESEALAEKLVKGNYQRGSTRQM